MPQTRQHIVTLNTILRCILHNLRDIHKICPYKASIISVYTCAWQ